MGHCVRWSSAAALNASARSTTIMCAVSGNTTSTASGISSACSCACDGPAGRDAAEGSTLHAFRVEQVQHVLRERLDAVPATMLVPHQPESRLERRHLPVPDRTGRAERRREYECLDHGRIVYE